TVRIGDEKVADAQSGEVLDDQRSRATGTDDADTRASKLRLTSVSEHQYLSVVSLCRAARLVVLRLGGQSLNRVSDDADFLNRRAIGGLPPDITRCGFRCEDQRTDRNSLREIE